MEAMQLEPGVVNSRLTCLPSSVSAHGGQESQSGRLDLNILTIVTGTQRAAEIRREKQVFLVYSGMSYSFQDKRLLNFGRNPSVLSIQVSFWLVRIKINKKEDSKGINEARKNGPVRGVNRGGQRSVKIGQYSISKDIIPVFCVLELPATGLYG